MKRPRLKSAVARLTRNVRAKAMSEEKPKVSDPAVSLADKDHIHTCVSIVKVSDGVVLRARCSQIAYKRLRSINAVKGRKRTKVMRRVISSGGKQVSYEAYIPNDLLDGRVRFEAVNAGKKTVRIWTFGRLGLNPPKNWHVGNYHLILYHDGKKPSALTAPRLPKVYLKSSAPVQGQLQFDLYAYGPDLSVDTPIELVVFKFRDEAVMTSTPMSVRPAKTPFRIPAEIHRKAVGHEVLALSASLNLESAFPSNGLYSVMVRIGDHPLRSVSPYSELDTGETKLFEMEEGDGLRLVYQITDNASKNIRLEHYRFDSSESVEARAVLSNETPTAAAEAERPVWLIGEYPSTARDNGWSLFRHLRESRPDIDARYVIARENLDDIDTTADGVVELGSLQHLKLSWQAEAILFTHHSIYPFPRLIADRKAERGLWTLEFFLQHGVLAIKPMLAHYERELHRSYDLFNVSSERERALVARRCRWSSKDIVVGGLPRWDALTQSNAAFLKGAGKASRLLIFPTWRAGLDKLDEETFKATDFYRHWHEAIEQISLKAADAGLSVDFCAHSILSRFGDLFAYDNVNIVSVKEAVERIPSYALLVTDYSSLCFDFLYLHKPTYFFMFDQETFFAKERPYIDITSELPGFAADTTQGLLKAMFTRTGTLKRPTKAALSRQREMFIGVGSGGGSSARVVEAAQTRIRDRASSSSAASQRAERRETAPSDDVEGLHVDEAE